MLLRSLYTLNYRNLHNQTLEFGPGINAIVGKNGQGKTNLLEAVYLALTGLSEAGKLEQLVQHQQQEGFVRATLERDEGPSIFEVGVGKGRRVAKVDGVRVKAGEMLRGSAVWIRPEDNDLVLGSPSARRGYLDQLLGKLSVRYAAVLALYDRNLAQRNASLRSGEHWALEVWDTQPCDLGSEMLTMRRRVLLRLQELVQAAHEALGGGNSLELNLLETTTPESYLFDLKNRRSEEIARGNTVLGPHRDDLELKLNGVAAQTFASRGEARTVALALRQAEFELLAEKNDEMPLLLIDDFSAELDLERRVHLLELAHRAPQALVTGTESFPRAFLTYQVEGGMFRR